MAYKQLTIDTIPQYLQTIDEVKNLFTDFSNLEIKEIGDGNLNYVYSLQIRKMIKKL